ncbi:MAG: tRNA (N(6)-L-threonylcarbamoyladenosine(37)-C(2))-methylthiotransferase MtaB [Eubacterium sp.]|nr:tRNA (N(6)-L-threonylcarbamoyladenosine(37)-C(2))-methylthiotransferase MtaB [Eubacterium sp.]
MKSVALHNLGCKVNGYEMDVMQQSLQEKGYKIVPFDEAADIYIINTCTVTNIADRKSRQMIHRARKNNPDAVVVAVGCYVQTGEESVRKDDAIDLAIGNNRKKDLIPILEEYLAQKDREKMEERSGTDAVAGEGRARRERETVTEIIDINHTDEYEEMTLTKTAEHTRAYIKIQDGCNQFCSYCIIPYARGKVRSRKEEDILNEVKGIVQAGYQEIVLTGIHISSYGIDRGNPELLRLLGELHSIDGLKRIRLGSLEPRIVTEEFAGRISAMHKICPHFHLSLQSGCDSVLKRMNRRYDTGEYFRTTELLRKYYSDPAITTDVIVGFPGETEEEFRTTEEFVRKVHFYEMHIFKYSRRQGTAAASMDKQLTEAQKSRRSALLMEAERQMSHDYRTRRIGTEAEVLFEEKKEIDGEFYWVGHTPQYVKAAKRTEGAENLCNQILKGTIEGFLNEDTMILK